MSFYRKTYIYMYIYSDISLNVCTYTQIFMYMCSDIYVHTYIYTYICTAEEQHDGSHALENHKWRLPRKLCGECGLCMYIHTYTYPYIYLQRKGSTMVRTHQTMKDGVCLVGCAVNVANASSPISTANFTPRHTSTENVMPNKSRASFCRRCNPCQFLRRRYWERARRIPSLVYAAHPGSRGLELLWRGSTQRLWNVLRQTQRRE